MVDLSIKFIDKVGMNAFFSSAQQADAIIEISSLSKSYGSAHTLAVDDVNLTIKRGEIFALMGTSGSGKSTLLRHINRLVEPTTGSVKVDGQDLKSLSAPQLRALRSRRIGMVFQHFGLLPHRTVLENVRFPLDVRGEELQASTKRAEQQLELVGLGHALNHYPDELSGGMQQRVGLARALVGEPDILLMDEPFGALDPTIRRDLQDQMVNLVRAKGITTILVTHDPQEAIRMADRLALLRSGRVVQVGTTREILNNPADDGVADFFRGVMPTQLQDDRRAAEPVPAATAAPAAGLPEPSPVPLWQRFLLGPARYLTARPSVFWAAALLETGALASFGLAIAASNATAAGGALAAFLAIRVLIALGHPLAKPRLREWLPAFSAALATQLLVLWRGLDAERTATLFGNLKDRRTAAFIGAYLDQAISWAQITFHSVFSGIVFATRAVIESVEATLTWLPWPVPALALLLAAWHFAGSGVFLLAFAAIAYLVSLGFWPQTISTISLVGAAVFLTITIGIPAGIFMARSALARKIISPLLDIMQTLPSFVYLIPAVAFFSVGKTPAVVATVVFAIPPMIRLTALGIREVPRSTVEAAYAHGATPFQVLTKIELPLAAPSLLLGVNQTIVMSLSMVVVSALIGAGGLGYDVVTALRNIQGGAGILAGLAIVFCALVPDRIIQGAMQKKRRSSPDSH